MAALTVYLVEPFDRFDRCLNTYKYKFKGHEWTKKVQYAKLICKICPLCKAWVPRKRIFNA